MELQLDLSNLKILEIEGRLDYEIICVNPTPNFLRDRFRNYIVFTLTDTSNRYPYLVATSIFDSILSDRVYIEPWIEIIPPKTYLYCYAEDKELIECSLNCIENLISSGSSDYTPPREKFVMDYRLRNNDLHRIFSPLGNNADVVCATVDFDLVKLADKFNPKSIEKVKRIDDFRHFCDAMTFPVPVSLEVNGSKFNSDLFTEKQPMLIRFYSEINLTFENTSGRVNMWFYSNAIRKKLSQETWTAASKTIKYMGGLMTKVKN